MSEERHQSPWPVPIVGLAVAVLSVPSTSGPRPVMADAGVQIHQGMGTGETYIKEMSDVDRSTYAMGFVNGMLMAPAFGAPRAKVHWFESCVAPMNNEQVAAIISKHLRDHPERWHHSLNFESYAAIRNACVTR